MANEMKLTANNYTLDLKLIAIITMLIDHLGFIFFPHQLIFRYLGRLAFPLFAWGVATGAKHTRDIKKYAWRLFLFALISQYPFYLFGTIAPVSIARLNVLFTLLFGLFAIQVYKSKIYFVFKYCFYFLLFAISYFLDSDYQITGVLSVLFAYIFYENLPGLVLSQFFAFSIPFASALWYLLSGFFVTITGSYSLLAPLAFFLTPLQSRHPNPKFKYLLYWVYPIQFLIFYFIKKI